MCRHIIDRKRQAEVHEASRSQLAAQFASIKQASMEASFALEGLATDKSRWEAEATTLRADMQTMKSEAGESEWGEGVAFEQFMDIHSIELTHLSDACRPSQDESRRIDRVFLGVFRSFEGYSDSIRQRQGNL